MRLTSKGQVTIPRLLRERYGLLPDTEVSFEPAADGVLIRPAQAERVKRVREAIVRTRGSAIKGLSTEAVMRLTRGED
jgi:bifunctional DNA-binding transcriptional regulator/antitoxin component of YhaV-PrlF toxin-antitoxin module